VDDLHDLLAGGEAHRHVGAERALLHARHELLDDPEVDVGLEECQPDLAHGAREVLLGEATATLQVAERGLELVGKRVKHRQPGSVAPHLQPTGGAGMAQIAKVIRVIGSSPESFAKAAQNAVEEASKTVRGISGADVVTMSAVVEGDRITEFRTTVDIAFGVER
jgi:flavin-binding protein dodecin